MRVCVSRAQTALNRNELHVQWFQMARTLSAHTETGNALFGCDMYMYCDVIQSKANSSPHDYAIFGLFLCLKASTLLICTALGY